MPIYLESRLQVTKLVNDMTRGAIKAASVDLEEGIAKAHYWSDIEDIKDQLFMADQKFSGTPANEFEIKVQFLDLPEFHCYSEKNCEKFFRMLKETN